MNNEHINSKENRHQEFIVQARQVDGNLWIIIKLENADRMNVPFGREGNNLRTIFKSTIFCEEEVHCSYLYNRNGKLCESPIYNLETLMFISCRIALFEASAFMQWVMKVLCNDSGNDKNSCADKVLIIHNRSNGLPLIVALN